MQAWRSLTSSALDLLFPPRCAGCRRRGAWFCERCRREVVEIVPPFCERCGQGIAGGRLCATCRQHPLQIDGLRAVAYLEGGLRQAIHAFKYNGVRALAQPLGDILAGGFTRHALQADLIAPVPLHTARHNQRGFNQSLLLAQRLATHAGMPVDGGDLQRVRDTRSQVGLNAHDRHDNVQNAFAWQGASLRGRRVLLIDDVCTTGATMEACAAALRSAGAASVWGLALARERWGIKQAGSRACPAGRELPCPVRRADLDRW